MDLTKGLGICAGLKAVQVPGATGNITTNFIGKARVAIAELQEGRDFVYIHVEAPDEAGHRGELDTKVKSIEEIDEKVIGLLLEELEQFEDYRMMVLPDHPTPLSVRTHTSEEVPFLIYQKSQPIQGSKEGYNEKSAQNSGLYVAEGHLLMDYFLRRHP